MWKFPFSPLKFKLAFFLYSCFAFSVCKRSNIFTTFSLTIIAEGGECSSDGLSGDVFSSFFFAWIRLWSLCAELFTVETTKMNVKWTRVDGEFNAIVCVRVCVSCAAQINWKRIEFDSSRFLHYHILYSPKHTHTHIYTLIKNYMHEVTQRCTYDSHLWLSQYKTKSTDKIVSARVRDGLRKSNTNSICRIKSLLFSFWVASFYFYTKLFMVSLWSLLFSG